MAHALPDGRRAALILLAAIEDIWRSRRIDMHQVDIHLASGDRLVFSTGSAAESGALVAALAGRS